MCSTAPSDPASPAAASTRSRSVVNAWFTSRCKLLMSCSSGPTRPRTNSSICRCRRDSNSFPTVTPPLHQSRLRKQLYRGQVSRNLIITQHLPVVNNLYPNGPTAERARPRSIVQHRSNFSQERLEREGFVQQRNVSRKDTAVQNHIVGVTRHEEHLHLGPHDGKPFGQFASVYLGHDQIAQQQVDCPGVLPTVSYRILGIGLQHDIAVHFQHLASYLAHLIVILDQQYSL